MSKKRDAALVRALAAIAAQKTHCDVDRTLIVRAHQLIKRLEGRDAGLRHHRPAKRRSSMAVAATVAVVAFCGTVPAYARGQSHDRTCAGYRVEHPDFRGPFDVIAHKAAWNGSGFDDVPDQFTCPAAPGGEGVPAMRLEKVPTSHKK